METITTDKPKMICQTCSVSCKLRGKHRNGLQRFQCVQCGKSYTEEQEKLLGNMTVAEEKALLALQLLIEGTSVRATERLTGLHRDTICRLLVLAGQKAEKIIATRIRNLRVQDVECDEAWGYIGKKEGHKKPDEADVDGLGDAYCFIAVERNTKLVYQLHVGEAQPTDHRRVHRRFT